MKPICSSKNKCIILMIIRIICWAVTAKLQTVTGCIQMVCCMSYIPVTCPEGDFSTDVNCPGHACRHSTIATHAKEVSHFSAFECVHLNVVHIICIIILTYIYVERKLESSEYVNPMLSKWGAYLAADTELHLYCVFAFVNCGENTLGNEATKWFVFGLETCMHI